VTWHAPEPGCCTNTTAACAIHCRCCFRREFPYGAQRAGRNVFSSELEFIRADSSVTEVLPSGGDPLTLSDRRLAGLLETLETIPHVRRVRVHTRLPAYLVPKPVREDAGAASKTMLPPASR
jgi:L-lysine 2,3-aminomutase